MEFTVNDNCIACGVCESICPQVFTLEGEKAEAEPGPIEKEWEAPALKAEESCPVAAISHE